MILREEIFEQRSGLGILELRGSGLELVLFVNGQPLIYDAADCAGSVGRFTVFLPASQDFVSQRQIEISAAQGFSDGDALHRQITPLLQLLPNGSYRLSLEDLLNDNETCYEVLDWEYSQREEAWWLTGYYPGYGPETQTIITTQPGKVLDKARVDFYADEIRRDIRPTLLVLSALKEDDSSFLLDGHHKARAYARCGVPPRILRIEFQKIESVSLDQAKNILSDVQYDDVPRYLQTKRKTKARIAFSRKTL